jgi:hypothetical protein
MSGHGSDGMAVGDVEECVGRYYNSAKTLLIETIATLRDLVLMFEGRDDETG